jgi:NAD(P)H-dependent FMN reductase
MPVKLALIVGSTREGRLGAAIARWFAAQTDLRTDLVIDVIDLAEADLPQSLDGGAPEVAALRPRLAEADAFVIVTPEYNHSFPAPLKTAIDCFHPEWQAKPVGFVSYGGISGGLRAVEQLRQVFAELHTVTIRDTVSFHNVWAHFDADGAFPIDSEACDTAAKVMLDQLVWWAVTLREAKLQRPYAA